MVEEKDYVGITCLSFAAGTACCAIFVHFFPFPSYGLHTLALISSILFFCTLISLCILRNRPVLLLTLFLCGFFCYSTAMLTRSIEIMNLPIAGRCAYALKKAIDSIPFRHEGCDAGECNALLKALLTADRSDLSPETKNAFRKSGASHILALSGMHMGIIYICISRMLVILGNSPRSRRIRSCCIILISGFFTLMTGASESLVRAFFFILTREICALTGRHCSGLRTLYIALTLQLATNPLAVSSAGFQLSYLAMAGIFILHPPMESWYPQGLRFDPMRKLWSLFSLSISCQIFTAPLSWALFGSFPVYFLITNLFAMPLTTITMALSIAILLCNAIPGLNRSAVFELLVRCDSVAMLSLIDILERIAEL